MYGRMWNMDLVFCLTVLNPNDWKKLELLVCYRINKPAQSHYSHHRHSNLLLLTICISVFWKKVNSD